MAGYLGNPKLVVMAQDSIPVANFEYASDPTVSTNPAKLPCSWLNTSTGVLFICTDNTAGANVWVSATGGMEEVTSPLDLYVATTGNDSNDGLTVGTPKLTLQAAVDLAITYIVNDTITINVAAGTYTGGVIATPYIGTSKISIVGVGSTTSFTTVPLVAYGNYNLEDVKLSAGCYLTATAGGVWGISGLDFGTTTGHHIYLTQRGSVSVSGNYTISGDTGASSAHIYAEVHSIYYAATKTITLTGTPAIGYFVRCLHMSFARLTSMTFTGTATGTRYTSNTNSVIETFGQATTYFPGSIAGSTAEGGIYT